MVLESLKAALNLNALDAIQEIIVFSEIDSTNSELLRRYNKGQQGSALVIAEAQSNGRGRRGRKWHSPNNSGLYMSFGMPFANSTKDLQALSLITAISVVTAISSICQIKLELKWPNDVLAKNKKLAGILLERHISQDGSYIVFGIGVNLELTQAQRNAIDRPVTDLNSLVSDAIEPERVAGAIVNELVGGVEKFLESGFKPFKDIWNDYDRYAEADIVIDNGAERLIGKSLGVNEEGSLVLLTATGPVTLNTGEIFPSLHALESAK